MLYSTGMRGEKTMDENFVDWYDYYTDVYGYEPDEQAIRDYFGQA